MNKRVGGFTIVELLIVIVVIGILAAITVIAFSGIQARAHDSAVQSDLSSLKKKMEIFAIESGGKYPNGLELPQMSFKTSRSSYAISPTTTYNLLVCHHLPDYDHFYAAALSKSGRAYIISDVLGSPQLYTNPWPAAQDTMCVNLGAPAPGTSNLRGYAAEDTTTGPWRAWAGGS